MPFDFYRRSVSVFLITAALLVQPAVPVHAQSAKQTTSKAAAQPKTYTNVQASLILTRLLTANQVPQNSRPGIALLASKQLNAATDGKNILVTDQLWRTLKTDDQRAFVIGHELAHVLRGHVDQTAMRRLGLSVLDSYVLNRWVRPNSVLDLAQNLGLVLVDRKFSRNYEYDADELGLALMSKAGYDPDAAVQVLEMFEAVAPSSGPGFLQDHPLNKARIQALARKYPQNQL